MNTSILVLPLVLLTALSTLGCSGAYYKTGMSHDEVLSKAHQNHGADEQVIAYDSGDSIDWLLVPRIDDNSGSNTFQAILDGLATAASGEAPARDYEQRLWVGAWYFLEIRDGQVTTVIEAEDEDNLVAQIETYFDVTGLPPDPRMAGDTGPSSSAASTPAPSAHAPRAKPQQYAAASFHLLEGAWIIAADGEKLGLITTNQYSADSLLNEYGEYGNPYSSQSIFNKYGTYGNPFSSVSPFNSYSTSPAMMIRNGEHLGYFTANPTYTPRADPEALIAWLRSFE